ncbi:MAG: hypothetical protein P0S96_04115 [Simkaniaceae bacterium]|nr:hypothetical protein [Candidatus Sacchlamyda saccharinae]
MAEIATFRKNKIELKEYDYSKDVQNRVLMAQFSPLDIEVLEEILYSSIRIPLSVLQSNLDLESDELFPILECFAKTGLLTLASDHVLVDKEMRKYYEFQVLKFEEDFKPGMDYLQGLLRKVPIHILPTWYSISRTSNNIFESIVEKYLETPQNFQRYLMDLYFSDPVQKGIMNAIYQSPHYEVDAKDIIKKFELTQEAFEEHMLHLEFSFVGCVKYVKEKNSFKQVITPFEEWKQYLCHVRDTEPCSMIDEDQVERLKESDFGCIEEMSTLLELANNGTISEDLLPKMQKKYPDFGAQDFSYYVEKFCQLNLADQNGKEIVCSSDASTLLEMDLVDRALFLYRHPLNTLNAPNLPRELCNSRLIREAEKSLSRAAQAGWVYLDDFIKGIFIPLREEHLIKLVCHGRTWKYRLPEYSNEEITFFKAIIQNWLLEVGITAIGTVNGRECFTLTPLGQDLFSNE